MKVLKGLIHGGVLLNPFLCESNRLRVICHDRDIDFLLSLDPAFWFEGGTYLVPFPTPHVT